MRPHATDKQWEYYELFVKLGSVRAVARYVGVARSSVGDRLIDMMAKAAVAGYEKPADPQPELKVMGVSERHDKDGNYAGDWTLKRQRGMDPSEAYELEEPKFVDRVATYTDKEGRVTGQWVTETRDKQQMADVFTRWVERAAEGLPARAVVSQATPLVGHRQDLLAVYPIGDHHHGMLAWALETGQVDGNYDQKISQDRLSKAINYLVNQTPSCDQALVAFLGDFFHYDSYRPVTPASGHLLDADVRFPKMLDLGLDLIIYVIEAAAAKHSHVRVIFEKGNHDPAVAAATTIFLKRLFRDNPRVSIDDSPEFFHYYQFGNVALMTNHGDKVKPAQQLQVMAADRPVMWGETTYRMALNGHVHHESRKEYPGGFVETFGVLAPLDAYAAQGGWRSMCQMHALVFHIEGRLASRHIVYPDQFE